MKKFYIATAIVYASAKPHIGNTYEIVAADAIARFKRLMGYDVYFQTGTDEHGQKIEEKALINNQNPQEYTDSMSLEIRRIWDVMNTSYDSFIRTTNQTHKEVVGKVFQKLYQQGDIYKGKYEGLYCVPCESFFTETQLINGLCPDCERHVEKTSEDAYFLKLSKYTDWLKQYIEENPSFLEPVSRKNEILKNFIIPGVQDLCVSRTSVKWGIEVPFDKEHVIYVWPDALLNYLTFIGYGSDEENMNYWPCDLHLIGKDIYRFHAVYFTIMLKMLDLEIPKKMFGHAWLLMDQDKMSKSKGNVLYADDLVNLYGVDALRYYLLNEIPYANDGTFTHELMIERFNSDLANTIGNLVHRTISMVNQYFEGEIPAPNEYLEIDKTIIEFVLSVPTNVEKAIDQVKISDSLGYCLDLFKHLNKYIDETMPWVLAKEDKERLKTVIYVLLESIRHGAVLLQSFIPDTSSKIFKLLNSEIKTYDSLNSFEGLESGLKVNKSEPLFIRIDPKEFLEKLKKTN